MKTIKELKSYNSRVFVRCDFNVPMEKTKILEDFKIEKCLETIKYLKKQGAKIVLASHLGKPQKNKKQYSLLPIKQRLEELLRTKIGFSKKLVGPVLKGKIKRMKPGQILLLENLRFNDGEMENDEDFAKQLASLYDSYVGEAFAELHRNCASMVSLPNILPPFIGFQMEKELKALSKLFKSPLRPLCVIIGGVKINSKIKVIEKFLKLADYLLFGSKIAINILSVKGVCIGRPWPDEEIVKRIEKINITDPKVHLPIDVLASPDSTGDIYIRETGVAGVRKDEEIFDIGQGTINKFSEVIRDSKTIFWAGPLGMFENKKFSKGTKEIARAISGCRRAFTVAGGGETIAALRKYKVLNDFSFVSTGGGAMLSYLSGEKLPGLEALK